MFTIDLVASTERSTAEKDHAKQRPPRKPLRPFWSHLDDRDDDVPHVEPRSTALSPSTGAAIAILSRALLSGVE